MEKLLVEKNNEEEYIKKVKKVEKGEILPSDVIIPKEYKKTYDVYKNILIASIFTAILLLVPLAWSEVIESTIVYLFPNRDQNTITAKLCYAIFITLFVVLIQIHIFPMIHG